MIRRSEGLRDLMPFGLPVVTDMTYQLIANKTDMRQTFLKNSFVLTFVVACCFCCQVLRSLIEKWLVHHLFPHCPTVGKILDLRFSIRMIGMKSY